MKFFALTFSIYIFLLAIVPCGDGEECNETQKISISENADHEHHDHEKETCTPFCFCSCCGTSIINLYDLVTFSDIVPVHSKGFPVFNHTFLSVEYFHIWQPPKIS